MTDSVIKNRKIFYAVGSVVALVVGFVCYRIGAFDSLGSWLSSGDYWADNNAGKINADKINKTVQTIAIIVGGVSAYMRFFYGQTLFCRIDPAISAEIQEINGVRYLSIHTSAKNVGNAGVALEKGASQIFLYQGIKEFPPKQPKSVYWVDKEWRFFSAFEGQEWIRSGETIEGEHLIELPPSEGFDVTMSGKTITLPPENLLALKISLRVIGEGNLFNRRGNEWAAFCILVLEKEEDAEPVMAKLWRQWEI